jgi:hypothetical protein
MECYWFYVTLYGNLKNDQMQKLCEVKKEQKICLGSQQSEFFLFTTKAETEAHPNHLNIVAFFKSFGFPIHYNYNILKFRPYAQTIFIRHTLIKKNIYTKNDI